MQQLKIFIDGFPDKTPFDALKYLTGECNYGGRVTEKQDRVTLLTILNDFYTEAIFDEEYVFSPSGLYYSPKHGDYQDYINYCDSLPQFPDPEVFGMHQNAAISKNLNATNKMLTSVMSTQQNTGGSGANNDDDVINTLANTILGQLPEMYDITAAEAKFPVKYE